MQNSVPKRHTQTPADEPHAASRNRLSNSNADALTLLPAWPREVRDQSLSGRRTLVAIIERELRKERRLGMAGNRAYNIARHARLVSLLREEREGLSALAAPQRGSPPQKSANAVSKPSGD